MSSKWNIQPGDPVEVLVRKFNGETRKYGWEYSFDAWFVAWGVIAIEENYGSDSAMILVDAEGHIQLEPVINCRIKM